MQKALRAWYGEEARDLPWRRTSDPYAILVSEIMLQQTRVETVLSYYGRFLERFPTVERLASSGIDDVLKAWEGLGYYRRAQNLHRAAVAIARDRGGVIPDSAAALAELPGIGPYTAGAVASIAFGADEPALDGNVVRVLSRLFRIPGNPARVETRARLRQAARLLLKGADASSFNQAMMDLGARICTARIPRCPACPLDSECDAHHAACETDYPERAPRRKIPHVDVVAGIVWESEPWDLQGRLLIAQRKLGGMLGGLWEFPGGRVEAGESQKDALVRELDEELAIRVHVLDLFMDVKHTYTHFRMTMHVYHCRYEGGDPQTVDCAAWRWARLTEMDGYAFSGADRKVLAALRRRSAIGGRALVKGVDDRQEVPT